jgi:3-(3-hydroxy-phenyl)propionate hydroxylase
MDSPDTFDIAIIGLGPVGSAAAILFADAGLRVAAFERDMEVYPLPRAVGMDGEVIRAFQRVGRSEELVSLLQATRPGDRAGFANSDRQWLFGNEFRDFGVNGWQPMSMFDQPEVEHYLRETARGHSNVTAHIGHDVIDFDDQGDEVVLLSRAVGSQQTTPTRASYLLACDGANSGTRRTLSVRWNDLGYDHDWLVVDVVALPGHTLGNDTLQVCDPDRLSTYIATKDPYRRWEFKLNAGESREEMLEHEKIMALIEPWTPRDTIEIRRAAVYQFHAATAESWRRGRVLLAGDAAHQTPPFLGQGMNAGMRDVINLAWKFPLLINGLADQSILDTYQAERGAHAKDLVQWAVAIGHLMEHLASVEAAQRNGSTPPEAPPGQQSSGYGQGRETPPLRDGIVLLDQVSDTGSTGYLFSQPIVVDQHGTELRLDEKLGPGFAIVAKDPSSLKLNTKSRLLIKRLAIQQVSLSDLSVQRGHFDRVFETATAAVVRPDRYVFGHTTDDLNLDELLEELASRMCLAQV